MKEGIRTKYGLDYITPSQIKLASCDGPLADDDSPQDADLEEDDLIDVTIKVTQFLAFLFTLSQLSEEQMSEAVSNFESNSKSNKNNLVRAATAPVHQSSTFTSENVHQPKATNSTISSSSSEQVYQINLLIPEALATTGKDLFISLRVTPIQTLQDILRGIRPHIVPDEVWFSLYNESDEQAQPKELALSTTITTLLSSNPLCSSELTLLIHPLSSRTIELAVNCHNKRGELEQSIKLIVKPSQTCRKMIERICTHLGVGKTSCSFTFNGKKLNSSDTFQSLGVSNGSQITIMKQK